MLFFLSKNGMIFPQYYTTDDNACNCSYTSTLTSIYSSKLPSNSLGCSLGFSNLLFFGLASVSCLTRTIKTHLHVNDIVAIYCSHIVEQLDTR